MSDYDFRSLSSYDFALLARDLLQAEMGIRLESFSMGPDSGIDFRFRSTPTNLTIVQCKHYADSGFSSLLSTLRRKERPKIDKLSPSRYVLATSLSLTPNRKSEVMQVLEPHCSSPADIYGKEDLNNLLCRHAEIERQHFKLWLTSEAVLRRVLHAGIFSDSEAYLDRVRLRLCRYVQNPSFDRARELLNKRHYCIIAGIPGIGKTTLAEVLLADLTDRQGFEPFRIAHSLDEIRPVKNSRRKQVFYFDDFLGTTALESFQKNEDRRLLELMEEVASNQNWRFILTTREYVLNAARFRSEAFTHPPVDLTLCVIKLDDYTRPIRARILYNHIYFSGLPREYKLALLQNRAYENILRHRNYNPRIIEYMTGAANACAVAPSVYLSEFTDSLEHPARIWDHAFRHRISEAGRHLLWVLATLPDQTLLADVESAFWAFYRLRQKKFGFSTKSGDWTDALKELDGTFLLTHRVGKDIALSFHSPSVRDYLEDFLFNSEADVRDLMSGACFYEQYASLWKGKGGQRYPGVNRYTTEFLSCLRLNMFGPTASSARVVFGGGEPTGLRHLPISNEERARFAFRIADELNSVEGDKFLRDVVDALAVLWQQGHADREDLVRLIESLAKRGLQRGDKAFEAAKQCLSTGIEELDHYRAIASFAEAFPGELPQAEIEQLRADFLRFATDYDVSDDDDPDWLRQVVADLEFVGERLEVDVTRFTEPLDSRASDIEAERAESEPDGDDEGGWRSSPTYGDDVSDMFEGLREELEA